MALSVLLFFKQKTAYEMRISDWSSDVCSSDLADCSPESGPARLGFRKGGKEGEKNLGKNQSGAGARAPACSRNGQGDLYERFKSTRGADGGGARSEERRVGTEVVRTCRYRGWRYH